MHNGIIGTINLVGRYAEREKRLENLSAQSIKGHICQMGRQNFLFILVSSYV